MTMQCDRFAAPLGAVVSGLDLRELGTAAADSAEVQQLKAWFDEHHVLVFPQQDLTPEQQMAFAAHWGELVSHPYSSLEGYPHIIELVNRGKRRDVNQHWHSDMTYNPAPPKLTMLYALEVPAFGGETAFANQILAYEELSNGLRAVIDQLQAEHTAEGLAKIYGEDPAEAPRARHPVVRKHDSNGKDALYVCRAFTRSFCGWSRQESKSLLEYLFEHSVRPEFQARHKWRAGDVVMWDNRCLLHYAVHDHGDDPRVIHRLQVQGPVPE